MLKNIRKLFRKIQYATKVSPRYKLDETFENRLRCKVDSVVRSCSGPAANQASLARQRFWEFFQNFTTSLNNVACAEHSLFHTETPHSRLQQDFVLYTEVFHEQVYKTLSAFGEFIRLADMCRNSPTTNSRSVRKFLEDTEKKNPLLNERVAVLLKSREYRSRIIVHSPKGIFNWITHCGPHGCWVLYFKPGNRYMFEVTSLYPKGYVKTESEHEFTKEPSSEVMHTLTAGTPLEAKEWFAVPHYGPVCKALYELTDQILDQYIATEKDRSVSSQVMI